MENEQQDRVLETRAKANRDKHTNYFAEEEGETDTGSDESIEDRRQRHDADSGNDGSSNEMLADEEQIDPGNEHHHTDADDDDDSDRSSRHDADAGGDGTGTAGPEPGEGENDAPDTTGEDG